MNDFTKKELEIILVTLSRYCGQNIGSDYLLPIMDNIKSMIDNYCEHEFIFTLNDSSVHCHKCNRKLNDNE